MYRIFTSWHNNKRVIFVCPSEVLASWLEELRTGDYVIYAVIRTTYTYQEWGEFTYYTRLHLCRHWMGPSEPCSYDCRPVASTQKGDIKLSPPLEFKER